MDRYREDRQDEVQAGWMTIVVRLVPRPLRHHLQQPLIMSFRAVELPEVGQPAFVYLLAVLDTLAVFLDRLSRLPDTAATGQKHLIVFYSPGMSVHWPTLVSSKSLPK